MLSSRAIRHTQRILTPITNTATSSSPSTCLTNHSRSQRSFPFPSCSCSSRSFATDSKIPTATHSSTISASTSTISAATRESAAAAIDKRIDKIPSPEQQAKRAHLQEREKIMHVGIEPSEVKTAKEKDRLKPTITYMGGPQYPERCSTYSTLYTPNATVSSHTPDDIGRYYQISHDMITHIPAHLNQPLHEELGTTGDYLLIRQTAYDIVQQLQTIAKNVSSPTTEQSLSGTTIAIKGQRGCGKTATLHYVAQYAREQNWLLLSTYGQEFMTDPHGFIKPSTIKPGTYDQSIFTCYWFRKILTHEREALRKIKLSKKYDYDWSFQYVAHPPTYTGLFVKQLPAKLDEAYSPEHNTLLDMVLLASKDVDQAARILHDFIHEVQVQTDVPVLVLIDNFNYWNQITEFMHPEKPKSRLIARELGMVAAFDELVNRAPICGATIWATTSTATPKFERIHCARATKVYEVTRYTDTELQSAITHYHISKLLLTQFDERWVYRVKALCGSVGRDVFNDACLT